MEANEIMIGDLLRVTKDVCIKKGTIVRVRAIDADDSLPQKGLKCAVRCQPIDDIYGMNIGGVWLNYLEPIPLTAEILGKNGFVPDNFSPYYLPIKDGSVRFSKHQYGLYCNILRPYQRYDGVCNYVHNLQHALRLCGIDKEIVL